MKVRSIGVASLGLLGVVIACGPLPAGPSGGPPVNDCSVSSCDKYAASAQAAPPTCNGGACLVTSAMLSVVVVVSLPEDSYAPSRSFLLTTNDLLNPSEANAACPQGQCFRLPAAGAPHGSYLPSAQVVDNLHFNLGNPGTYTAIPVHATYRYLYGKSGVEAASLGLPIPPVAAQSVSNPDEAFPGPFGGPAIEFQAFMQTGLYERTITPDPPLDTAFPPDVNVVEANSGFEADKLDMLDATPGFLIPTFHISRTLGLDGWTAYLRDASTGRRISTVVPLSGSDIPGVVLPTNHHPPNLDALDNVALVVAPPPGAPIPAEIFTQIGPVFPTLDIVSDLPIPASVRGTVVGPDGQTPVEADLVFELTAAYDVSQKLQPNNFEFETVLHARLDATTGTVPFFASLPRGTYRLSIRPLGGASAVTVINPFTVQFSPDVQSNNVLTVGRTLSISGFAEVADSRLLSGATVVAIPTQCASMAMGTSDACLPRMRQTTTSANGTFGTCDAQGNGCPLLLDPGEYDLQVRPQAGTRLPWVYQTLSVDSSDVALPVPILIPAPVYAGLVLHDPFDNGVDRAVVTVFTTPCPGQPAIEVGAAVTDENGLYDMYLDPTITNPCH